MPNPLNKIPVLPGANFKGPVVFRAGAADVGRYPARFVSGPLLTTPVVGAQEFLTDSFYGTITTGTARKEFVLADAAMTSGLVPLITTNGRLMSGTNISYEQDNSHGGATYNLISMRRDNAGAGVNFVTALNIGGAAGGSGTSGFRGITIGLCEGTSNTSDAFRIMVFDNVQTGEAGNWGLPSASSTLIRAGNTNGLWVGATSGRLVLFNGTPNTANRTTSMDSSGFWLFGPTISSSASRRIHASGTTATEGIRVESGAAGNVGSIELYSAGTSGIIAATVGINASAGPMVFAINAVEYMRLTATAHTFAEAVNFVFGTTTGSKLGSAATQKIGAWGATPIVQPTTAIAAATFVTNTSGTLNDSATFDGYTIGQVVKALRNTGWLA